MSKELEYQYTYNNKISSFKLDINVYPQEDLERLIYDFLCVSTLYSDQELKEIGSLSNQSFMMGLSKTINS